MQGCVRRLTGRRDGGLTAAPVQEDLRACFDTREAPTNMADLVERFAAASGATAISVRRYLRRGLWQAASAGGHNATRRLVRQLVADYAHPTRLGHEFIAELIDDAIAAAGDAAPSNDGGGVAIAEGRGHRAPFAEPSSVPPQCEGAPAANGNTGPRALLRQQARKPPPSAVCAFGAALQPLVIASSGWHYKVERSRSGMAKPGFVATRPGAQIDLCYRMKAGGAKAPFQFAYLASYERMGVARGECVRGCTCEAATWSAHREGSVVSQPDMAELTPQLLPGAMDDGGNATCPCQVRLTLLNRSATAGARAGTKWKLLAVFSGLPDMNGATRYSAIDTILRAE